MAGTSSNGLTADFTGITGPKSFGSGGFFAASASSGDLVGVGQGFNLFVPVGYVSDAALSSSSTFAGQTLDSLGVTPGTYTYTFGSGVHADSFTVVISPSAVPEPASLALLGSGLAVALGSGYARRRRASAKAA